MHLGGDFNLRSDVGAKIVARGRNWLGLRQFDSIALERCHFELTTEEGGLKTVLLTVIKVVEGRLSIIHFCRVLQGLGDIKRKFLIVVHVFYVLTVAGVSRGLVDRSVGSFFGMLITLISLEGFAFKLISLAGVNELLVESHSGAAH